MLDVLLFALVPTAAMMAGAAVTLRYPPGRPLLSACQHLAAGVVTAAVAVELLPAMLEADALVASVIGYLLGLVAVLMVKRLAERGGAIVPIVIDLFVDGLLLAIGFAAGQMGGFILMLGLTLETLSLGLATAPSLARSGLSVRRIVWIHVGFGAAIVLGALTGGAIPTDSANVISLVLGFGISALLYLVFEELMSEAHEVEDKAATTAMFFLGFLVPLVLGHLS